MSNALDPLILSLIARLLVQRTDSKIVSTSYLCYLSVIDTQ